MAITATSVIARASRILQDIGYIHWPAAQLLDELNAGQREVVRHKPDAYVVNESVALTSGTKQDLPSGGLFLLDVFRNMGTTGSTPGNAIRLVDRHVMDYQQPDWHTVTPAVAISYYMFDPRDPTHWYCSPPSDGTGQVEIAYSTTPAAVAAVENDIVIPDVYADALVDYILYRALSRTTDFSQAPQRAMAYYSAFLQSLGQQEQAEAVYSPAAARDGGASYSPHGGGRS